MIHPGQKRLFTLPPSDSSGSLCLAIEFTVIFAIFLFLSFDPFRSSDEGFRHPASPEQEEPAPESSLYEQIGENSILVRLTTDNGTIRVNTWTNEKSLEFVLPTSEAELERRTKSLEMNLQSRHLLPGETIEEFQQRMNKMEAAYWGDARSLSNEILGPIDHLIGNDRIVIEAEGSLQQINFAALPKPHSEIDEPIILTNEVAYRRPFRSITDRKARRSNPIPPSILVVADPVFSSQDERVANDVALSDSGLRSISGGTIPRIPETSEEANSIESLVGAGRATVLTGLAADRDGVLNSNLSNFSVIHFATHGTVDSYDPEKSGLVLSGFYVEQKSASDGSLKISDIAGLDLQAELVVLSGCETGKGKVVGKEMVSLKTAFLNAGAKTVVSSLWKVGDAPTKDLMAEFYRALVEDGLSVSAAMRHAQLKIYSDPRYRSPFYWAAFTVAGEYDLVPQLETVH